jgi:GMP synthase-like glutamine amidotransferase
VLAGALASPLFARRALALPIDPAPKIANDARSRVLFVVIDRPEDATVTDHAPNIRGLTAAVRAFDPMARITTLTIADVARIDAATLDATYRPLAIIGAGSFTEWHKYGVDAHWKHELDQWMEIVRTTSIPMLAICGSHQLVAAAFNGFGAVAHMADRGDPVRISDELAASSPRGMWPNPRVGEEGTYPIVATTAGADDPLVRQMPHAPMAAAHHKDMVVDTTGFSLLYRGDHSRAAATSAPNQTCTRCHVQAMKRDDARRLLYTSQFHPEMAAFDESTGDDGGFGAAWVSGFLDLARRWWSADDLTIRSRRAMPLRDGS